MSQHKNELEYFSYNEWQKMGYQVVRGETSHRKEDGLPLFSSEQVVLMDDQDYDLEELDFRNHRMDDQ